MLPYQRADVESPDRFRWNCWARQTGKSFTKTLRRVLRGLRRRRTQIFLSAGERQSRELIDKARQHCQALRIATSYHDERCFRGLSIRQLSITLPGGVRIIALPANPQTARGYTGDLLLDEFAMHAFDRDQTPNPGSPGTRSPSSGCLPGWLRPPPLPTNRSRPLLRWSLSTRRTTPCANGSTYMALKTAWPGSPTTR